MGADRDTSSLLIESDTLNVLRLDLVCWDLNVVTDFSVYFENIVEVKIHDAHHTIIWGDPSITVKSGSIENDCRYKKGYVIFYMSAVRSES